MNPCPDLSLLSQFLDHELGGAEEEQIKQHLESCPACRAQVERIERTEGLVRVVLTRSLPRYSMGRPSPECLSLATVSAYVQRVLRAEDEATAERHLHTCDACLHEVRDAFRIVSSLASAHREPVPAPLQARVAALWEGSSAREKTIVFSLLVIEIAQKGLRLLEQHLAPPLLDVQELFVPMPAYRAPESPSILNLKINCERAEIRATLAQEGDGVALKMTLLDAGQQTLAGQRVFLRQHGRSIFSARTDQAGVLRMPRLEPGIYEVACPGIPATFQLELRP
jgi:anti-sigma factor RsiW